jgi:hypothetical protein
MASFEVSIFPYSFFLYINHFSMMESSIFAVISLARILLTNITEQMPRQVSFGRDRCVMRNTTYALSDRCICLSVWHFNQRIWLHSNQEFHCYQPIEKRADTAQGCAAEFRSL